MLRHCRCVSFNNAKTDPWRSRSDLGRWCRHRGAAAAARAAADATAARATASGASRSRSAATASRRTATFAITVADPSGAPIPNVLVTSRGRRHGRRGPKAGGSRSRSFPSGRYTVRFEQAGFITVERELTATAGKPIEIKVTMKPVPAPPPPPAPPAPEPSKTKRLPATPSRPCLTCPA